MTDAVLPIDLPASPACIRFSRTPGDWYVSPTATIVGDVAIGASASFWFGCVVRGDVAPVTIGERTNVQDNVVIHCDHGVPNEIGADVVIGHGAILHGRSVGEGCLIGMGATVLGRTRLGQEVLVAAGAVVPPGLEVPDRHVVMGVPGKIARPVKESELAYMRFLRGHYVALARRYVEEGFAVGGRPCSKGSASGGSASGG